MIDRTAPHAAQVAALHAIFKLRQRWRHKPSGRIARVTRIVDGHLVVVVKFEDGRGFGIYNEQMIDPTMTREQRIEYHSARGRMKGNPRLIAAVNSGYDVWERV